MLGFSLSELILESKGWKPGVVVKDLAQGKHSLYGEQNTHTTFVKGSSLARLTMNNSYLGLEDSDTPAFHSALMPTMQNHHYTWNDK